MKALKWKRISANCARIQFLSRTGKWIEVPGECSITQAVNYCKENNEDVFPYYVALVGEHKNGRRHILQKIFCSDANDAVDYFGRESCEKFEDGNLQLFTGDWKLVACRPGKGEAIQILNH